jgi:hypothetical protein
MASTITNFSSIVDVQFPVPGQDNDTQGFRTNFGAIVSALETAQREISNLDIEQVGIINQLSNITDITTFNGTVVTATIITATVITSSGNITANGKFIGDGSLITNISMPAITSIGTLTSLTLSDVETTATLTSQNNRLLLSGVSGITLVGDNTVSATLLGYSGSGPGFFDSTLTLSSIVGIDVGYTFKIYNTETSAHTVLAINTVTNSITTDPFDSSIPQGYGFGAGSIITFTQGLLVGSVSYASSTPTLPNGKSTDKKGYIFADATTIYISYADFGGGNPIWNSFNHVALTSTVTNLTTRVSNLESTATFFTTLAPTTSKGQAGDRRGFVFANGSWIYMCYANWVSPGTADIWARVSNTSTTWS